MAVSTRTIFPGYIILDIHFFQRFMKNGPNCNFSQLSMENATEIDGRECIHITCTWEIYS